MPTNRYIAVFKPSAQGYIAGISGQQRAAVNGDLAQHCRPPPHSHGLAKCPQEQGSLLCQKRKDPHPWWWGIHFVPASSRKHLLPPQNFDLCEFLAFGDIYPNALDHFCGWVEEVDTIHNEKFKVKISKKVIVPIFRNENNMMKFPQCVSYDIKKQVNEADTCCSRLTSLSPRCTSWRQQSTKSGVTSRAVPFFPSPRWPLACRHCP